MKYLIENCPAFDDQARCTAGHIITGNYLKECECFSNCLLKQIVELCKKQKKWESEKMESGQIIEIYNGAYDFAQEVLNLLEIQEVE